MRIITSLLFALALAAPLAACSEPTPIPGPVCGDAARLEYCKEACAADALCAGGEQPACELDCRACRVDDSYCPVEPR